MTALLLLASLVLQGGETAAYFFVSHDCPISNYYSQEIRRVCEQYGARGLRCSLVYVDPNLTDDAARMHADEYAHGAYPKIVDRKHELVERLHATVTPQVVVVRPDSSVAYTGRIDNLYAGLGKKRRVATEHDLRDALDAIVAGKPVARPSSNPVGCFIPPLSAFSR
jgi:hypothetical protein